MTLDKKKNLLAGGFIFLSVIYLVFISIYSINQYDLGFQISMVSRIKSGEIIYKDFDYVRPFFGIIFWDFLLKPVPAVSDYLVLISRVFVIIQSLIISAVIQRLIFKKNNLQLTIFLSICFLHTFPIMPWHTIDGIFFSVIGLFFFKKKFHLSAIIFIVLASFTKQSFFIFSFLMIIFIILDLYKTKKFIKTDIAIFLCTITVFLFSLFYYGIIENFNLFLQQVFRSTTSANFFESSVAVYFPKKILGISVLILLLTALYFSNIKKII